MPAGTVYGLFQRAAESPAKPLGYLPKMRGNTCILNLRNAPKQRQQTEYARLIQRMVDDYGMQRELALEISGAFWRAVYSKDPPEYSSKSMPALSQKFVEKRPEQIENWKEKKDMSIFDSAMNLFGKSSDAVNKSTVEEMYQRGKACYDKNNFSEAVKWFRKAAEQGDMEAQKMLGVCYAQGAGVPKDYNETVKWFRRAAEQGDAATQFALASLYNMGDEVEKDVYQAAYWYQKAAEQGNAEAQRILGAYYLQGAGVPKDNTEAVKWLCRAAEQGDALAQYALASFYYNGDVVEKDVYQAAYWYLKAAEQGNVEAQRILGAFYLQGTGVPKDNTEAVKWLRKAAEQGDSLAQSALNALSK